MSRFEDNLWESVVDEHGDDLSSHDAPSGARGSESRPRLVAGATVGVAATATAVTLLLSATSSQPAYAVTRHQDGTVAVEVNTTSGLVGANRRLAAMGIHARVLAVAAGKPTPMKCLAAGPGASGKTVLLTPYPKTTQVLEPATVTATTAPTVTATPKTTAAAPVAPTVTATPKTTAAATVAPTATATPKATAPAPVSPTVTVVPRTVAPTRTTAPTLAVPITPRGSVIPKGTKGRTTRPLATALTPVRVVAVPAKGTVWHVVACPTR